MQLDFLYLLDVFYLCVYLVLLVCVCVSKTGLFVFFPREKKREWGNKLFAREDYTGAINSYSK
jgi:hypothetical protein